MTFRPVTKAQLHYCYARIILILSVEIGNKLLCKPHQLFVGPIGIVGFASLCIIGCLLIIGHIFDILWHCGSTRFAYLLVSWILISKTNHTLVISRCYIIQYILKIRPIILYFAIFFACNHFTWQTVSKL